MGSTPAGHTSYIERFGSFLRQDRQPIKAAYQGLAGEASAAKISGKAVAAKAPAKASAAKPPEEAPAAPDANPTSAAPSPKKGQILKRVGENIYRSDQSGVLYAILTVNNRQIRRSLQTSDKSIGRQRLEKLRLSFAHGRALQGRVAQKATALGFVGLATRWLDVASSVLATSTAVRRRHTIRAIAPFFPDRITVDAVEKWAVARSKQIKAATFNKELETVQLVCGYAVEHGLLLENPAAHLKRRRILKPQVVIPTREQFRALVAELRRHRNGESAAELIELLAYSGCRLGEALALRWTDVDFQESRVIVGADGRTKSGKSRVIPLFAPLRRLITAIQSKTTSMASQPRILSTASAKVALTNACRRLNCPHIHHHSLRHFFATNCLELAIPPNVVAGWLGHSDGGALLLRTYGHLRPTHEIEMATRVKFDATQTGFCTVTKE